MTISEILNVVLGIKGAAMARANKTTHVQIPLEDGGYAKVTVQTAQMNATKAHDGYNAEAAVAEYKAWEAENALKAVERANKPKTVKGPNPEAQARRDELDAKISALPSFAEYTATDILNALAGQVAENVTVMAIGQSAKRLVEKGILTTTAKDGDKKTYYTKA